MCNENGCKGIADILNTINILQNNAECSETSLNTCDRGFLGCSTTSLLCNTRPVLLYTCQSNGTPLSMPTTKDDITCTDDCSSVFRVEKVDGCCATFRVLEPNPDTTEVNIPYVATNSFFTMNLECCCAIRCLSDTYVECI